jgi:hypothetical protein
VKFHKCVASGFTSLIVILPLLAGSAAAQSLSSKYACSEPNPEQACNAANTCGSASSPCTVDVKRTSDFQHSQCQEQCSVLRKGGDDCHLEDHEQGRGLYHRYRPGLPV